MPRFAFSEPSIGSTTTRGPPAADALAELLGDEREALVERLEAREHDRVSAAASIAVVSSPPSPGADDGLALGARRQLGEHARATSADGVAAEPRASRSQRVEEQAGEQLREEVGRLLRHHLAAARGAKTSSIRVGRSRSAASRLAARRPPRPPRRRPACSAIPSCAERVDELRRRASPSGVLDRGRSRRRGRRAGRPRRRGARRRRDVARRACADARGRAGASGRSRAPVARRDEHDEHLRARRRALLLVERERRLVAVVAVGDQQLRRRRRGRRVGSSSRQSSRALDLEVRLAVGRARAAPAPS